MNLINFHKYSKNQKYIQETKIYYRGQGLSTSYWVMPIGNGFNIYTFILEYNNKLHTVIVEENNILAWRIADADEFGNEPYDTLEFNALGKIKETGEYIWLKSDDSDNFKFLNTDLKVKDITVTNSKPDEPFLHIANENIYVERMKPRYILTNQLENYDDKLLETSKKINYEDLFKSENKDRQMYFVIDGFYNQEIIPFNLISCDRENNTLDAVISYNRSKIYVKNIKLDDYLCYDECGEYNIYIKIHADYNILNEQKNISIDEYCFIAID
jgi:hypothetical protein